MLSWVAYLIYAGRIANPDIQNWKWRARNKGPDDHAEHLHVSVKSDPALADDVSPWPVQASSPSGQIITQPKLKRGDRGDWVRELQRLLGIEQDGEFGEKTEAAVRAFQQNHGLVGDGIADRYTWRALLPANPQQSEPARIFPIKATVFKDAQLAYGPRPADTVGVSLPARFEKPPKLWIRNRSNGLTAIAETIDVGPWNTNDPYWERNGRPQAESGTDKQARRTNRAGIDLYPETRSIASRPPVYVMYPVMPSRFTDRDATGHLPAGIRRSRPCHRLHGAAGAGLSRLRPAGHY
jgi:Putative peptidoglycan binding domain